MFKDSKAFIRNTIVYFIPFVIMTIMAVVFLKRTFTMLEEKNMSIMEAQMQNVFEKIEDELSLSMEIANGICVDTSLDRNNMLKFDISTLHGIDKLQMYKARMDLCSDLFVYYQSENIVTEKGTTSMEVFLEEQLKLSQQGKNTFHGLIQGKEAFSYSILEKKDGTYYLLLFYYYPKSVHVEEKRIGFLVEIKDISDILQDVLKELDCMSIVLCNDQVIAKINCLQGNVNNNYEQLYKNILDEKKSAGYTVRKTGMRYSDMTILIAVNNRSLSRELFSEGVKMAVVGSVTFVILSMFLWGVGKYRYRILNEIKQFVYNHYPEYEETSRDNDYKFIRKVLEKDLERLQKQNEDFQTFMSIARQQLTWLLLSSNPPYELEIENLLESYEISEGGPYYGVIEFLLIREDELRPEEIIINNPEIFLQYTTQFENATLYIVCVSLDSRDGTHEKRVKLISNIRKELQLREYYCKKISCGLVYQNIREIHNSQNEAIALIQDITLNNSKEVIFFDEKAHVIKRVPHVTYDLLNRFKEFLLQSKLKEAKQVFNALVDGNKNATEDLVVYVRYKVLSVMLEVASERGVSDKEIRNMMVLSNVESQSFEAEVTRVIERTFEQVKVKSPDVEKILEFIEENYWNPELGMQMLEEHFKISGRSISRIMRREINRTYKEYLNEIRLKKACELLESSEWSIQKIANEIGFYDVSGFYKSFKQAENVTPDEYRNSKKGKSEVQ